MEEKDSLSQGEEEDSLCNLDSSLTTREEFSHGKELLPDVVPDHVRRVVDLHEGSSDRANHREAEETVRQQAVVIDKIGVAHMPRAVLPHQK